MKRVLVIGSPGSGKSTFAAALSDRTGIPAHQFDQLLLEPGWVLKDEGGMRDIMGELVRAPSWIIDGQYYSTMDIRPPLADTVIFLDLPTRLCLWRVLARTISNIGRVRPGMPAGCPEWFD